jgi:hypothetical protein
LPFSDPFTACSHSVPLNLLAPSIRSENSAVAVVASKFDDIALLVPRIVVQKLTCTAFTFVAPDVEHPLLMVVLSDIRSEDRVLI